jgi:hypothetical protein
MSPRHAIRTGFLAMLCAAGSWTQAQTVAPAESLSALPASAPSTTRPTTGSFAYSLVPDSSDDIHDAINRTVGPMNFIIRPIARGRLDRTNPTTQRVHLDFWRDSVGVSFDDGNAVVTPYNGATTPWQNSLTHETYEAHMMIEGDTICQYIAAPDGVRENAYLFADSAKRLYLHVTVTSHRLPKPLEYTLAFRRDTGP